MNSSAPAEVARSPKMTIIAAAIGTLVEWYDYNLFAVVAATTMNSLFFPDLKGQMAILVATAIFAAGYVVRPIGGLLIANVGDEYGRKPALLLTLVSMGVGTVGIGLLPTVSQVGNWAVLPLIVLRIIQGFGAGAELSGALTLVSEFVPARNRGFVASLIQASAGVGGLLAVLSFLGVSQLPNTQFLSWGWRIPFLFAGMLCLAGFFARKFIDESPEWLGARRAARARGEQDRIPLRQLLKEAPGSVLRMFLVWNGHNCILYLCALFPVTYLVAVAKMPRSDALEIALLATVVLTFSTVTCGRVSDLVGHRRMMIIAMALAIVAIAPFMIALGSGQFGISALAVALGVGGVVGISNGAVGAISASSFEPRVRFSGITAGKEASAALVGGPTPAIASMLLAADHGAPWLVVAFVIVVSILAIGALILDGRSSPA